MEQKYVIGVDFGTDSVRSVIINAFNGEEIASSVFLTHDGRMDYIVILQKINSDSIL